jgi:hypothetical protein
MLFLVSNMPGIAEKIARLGSSLNWNIIIERACSWNWQRGVYLALLLARELAGDLISCFSLRNMKLSGGITDGDF